jgi:hypothetical protein
LVLWVPPNQGPGHLVPVAEGRSALVDYVESGGAYHRRILLSHLADSGCVVVTPTGDVFDEESGDTVDILPFVSGRAFPIFGRWILFVRGSTLDRVVQYKAEARTLAGIIAGATFVAAAAATAATEAAPAAAVDADWGLPDPAWEELGWPVAVSLVTSADTETRGPLSLVKAVPPGEVGLWTVCEKVKIVDRAWFFHDEREGTGLGAKLLSLRDGVQGSVSGIRHAHAIMSFTPKTWPHFASPSASSELAYSLEAAGVDLIGFCAQWEQASGIPSRSVLAAEHRCLIFTFWLACARDRVSPTRLARLETTARRILQIQGAVGQAVDQHVAGWWRRDFQELERSRLAIADYEARGQGLGKGVGKKKVKKKKKEDC